MHFSFQLTEIKVFSKIPFILFINEGTKMELKEYFSTQCRGSAVLLKSGSPAFKTLVSGKNGKNKNGIVATYNFDSFKLDISYIEQGSAAYAQQTIWLSFALDCDPTIPFSVYDILAFAEPTNFNCYTYTFVDSKELMRECFGEINELLISLIPKLTSMLQNGITKNRLITSQRENVNRYFGDNVLESGDMLGGAADKIINMMLKNFFEAQIESAVVGAQSLFFTGKTEKALKKLKKSKYRSQYNENLIKHIENGGKTEDISPAVKNASVEKGVVRHGGGAKGALKLLAVSLFFDILVSVVLFGIFYLICTFSFKNSIFITGISENIILIPLFASLVSMALGIHFIKHREKKAKAQGDKTIHSIKFNKATEMFLKYFTIIAECVAILGLLTCVNSTAVFYENSFKYSEEIFPLSQSEINYSAIDYFALIDGYTVDGKFQKDPHIIAVTKSGEQIDLYNSTFFSAEKFKEKSTEFFEDKGIEFKEIKTFN